MRSRPSSPTLHPTIARPAARPLLAGLAVVHIALHLFTSGNYGIFRDEFYYLDCADHLAWGYVDHPPFSIALLAAVKAVLGDSIAVIRLLPMLLGGLVIVLAGLIAAQLGGGFIAQAVAALAALAAPSYTVISGFYSMNIFDITVWTLVFYLLVLLINTGRPRLWVAIGLLLGIGLLNKVSVLVLMAGIAAGMLLTPERRWLRDRRSWAALGIALVLFLPHILWQVKNEWPTLEFMRNAQSYKIARLTPLEFIAGQLLEMGPAAVLVWGAGLVYLLATARGRRYRLLAFVWLIALGVFIANRSKPYYLVPAYPPLLAAGGCALERWLARPARRLVQVAAIVLLVAGGIVLQPVVRPFLPPAHLVRYLERLGIDVPAAERQALGALPQHFADRFGWPELVQAVAGVYAQLPPGERAECAILAANYGEAGAINYFGRRYGLPRAVSGHNNHYLWGPGTLSPRIFIAVGFDAEDLAPFCDSVEQAATIHSAYAMPYESDLPVLVVRGLRLPVAEAWRRLKMFI